MQRLIVKVRSSLLGYWEVILIYPALFLYIFSNDLNLISQSALIYRKLCLHEYNETICNSIHSHTKESNRVQELTSQFQIILNVAFMAPAILSLIHLSSLADRRLNYEIPLVVSLIGSLAQALVCIFVPKADFELAYYLLILSQVVNGICGAGSLAFISSCFSHVANYESRRFLPRSDQAPITSNNSNSLQVRSHRSIRYSICESCNLLGQFIGSIASGHLIGDKLNLNNFESVYIISFSLYFVVLIYTVAMFRYLKWRERRLTQTNNNNNSSISTSSSSDIMSLNTSDYLEADFQIVSTKRVDEDIPNQINGDNHQVAEPSVAIAANNNSRCSCFKNQLKFLEETWQLLRKPRPNNARFIIISLLVLFFLGCSISMGIMANQYLYVIKKPIQLSQVDYGYFKAYNTLCRALALLVVLPMLKKFLNAPDYLLFILGFTSEFLNLVFFSLAYFFKYFIWIAPISYMFSNYFVVCIRSYSSKLVDKHETGKYFGLIGVTEFLVLLTSSSLFSFIYSNTVSFFPPFVFLLGCGISIVICYPFLIYIIRELKRYHLSDTETQ